MAKITYIEHGGTPHPVEVAGGTSVMEGAVRNDVPGIDGECGGACACATCHVLDEAWRERAGQPNPNERDMIEFANHVGPGSRLSCQSRYPMNSTVSWFGCRSRSIDVTHEQPVRS